MPTLLSIIIPVYSEAESLPGLFRELEAVLSGLPESTEVIWVDDGSADGSFELLNALAEADSRHSVVRFRANFGQTAAIQAGIRESRGEILVFMDADGQNDPADIPRLLEKLEQGADCVSGWRKRRMDAFFTRVLPSKFANWLIAKVTRVPLHDFGCTLKAYRREYLEDVNLYGEMHRFIPYYAKLEGARIAELAVNHRPRARGVSKYGLARTFRVLLDLLTVKFLGSYFAKPAHLFGGLGLALLGASGLAYGWVAWRRLHDQVFVKDQPMFLLAALFALIGLQLLVAGLLAEVLVRTYYASGQHAPYRIREIVRGNSPDAGE